MPLHWGLGLKHMDFWGDRFSPQQTDITSNPYQPELTLVLTYRASGIGQWSLQCSYKKEGPVQWTLAGLNESTHWMRI